MHTEPTPLTDRLSTIEGLDSALALHHAGGQTRLLTRVLRCFVVSYRQGLPMLLDAAGDEHQVVLRWRATCHSARGALAQIGASALLAQTLEFERVLHALAPRAGLMARGRQLHDGVASLADRLAAELDAASIDEAACAA